MTRDRESGEYFVDVDGKIKRKCPNCGFILHTHSRSSLNSASNWRYKVIKSYRRRALKFLNESKTIEQSSAWQNVIDWFDDILEVKRLNVNEAISLPNFPICEVCKEPTSTMYCTENVCTSCCEAGKCPAESFCVIKHQLIK